MRSAGRNPGVVSRVVAICLVAAAGCRSSEPPASDDPSITAPSTSTIPTTSPSSTTASVVPLDQDPPVVEMSYAQRVLDEISRLDGEASRILYRERRLTPEVDAIITAIFFASSLEDNRRALETDLGVGLRTWRDPPGNPVVRAIGVVSNRPGCVALRVDSDLRPRYANYSDVQQNIGLILQRNIKPTEVERQVNPSMWVETLRSTKISESELSGACK